MPRVLLRSLFALVVAAAAVLIGWRVLRPAEVLATATPPYPTTPAVWPHVIGRTPIAPLIVEDRVRIYASKRQIRADAPADADTVRTAIWSFRRWPEQLSGVVATGHIVISRWSDGALVAGDAGTGKIVWRAEGPSGPGYSGHRTGAGTVWQPDGLRVAGHRVLVTAGGQISAYEASTGARLWTSATACDDGFTTAGGQLLCPSGALDSATGAAAASFPAGPYTPVGCDVASSGCAALRDAAGHGWLTAGATPVRAAALDRPDATVAAGLVFYPEGNRLRSVDPVTGAARHDYPVAHVLGVSAGRVVLLTADRTLLAIDPRTGLTVARYPMANENESLTWDPGLWQVTDRFVAVERLAVDRPDNPDTPGYYFSVNTVLIAEL
ncbi:PQQ-like beta-propeller repeat protein [Actinoplanes sp. KI2]|uniref:PQQ-like beta-propeller repeat protein n=1 Tax=Actinoplanes sp. KI2 TaxID=2983315 RepID=UPI0021D5C8F8|nr:PQQ-like beta-propeller repeat protein [Actinoplanes sp. KI2]MCU7727237.1 PQQ-like beta-propeller repeat protein [Actinoplanes sp. KI2]